MSSLELPWIEYGVTWIVVLSPEVDTLTRSARSSGWPVTSTSGRSHPSISTEPDITSISMEPCGSAELVCLNSLAACTIDQGTMIRHRTAAITGVISFGVTIGMARFSLR